MIGRLPPEEPPAWLDKLSSEEMQELLVIAAKFTAEAGFNKPSKPDLQGHPPQDMELRRAS